MEASSSGDDKPLPPTTHTYALCHQLAPCASALAGLRGFSPVPSHEQSAGGSCSSHLDKVAILGKAIRKDVPLQNLEPVVGRTDAGLQLNLLAPELWHVPTRGFLARGPPTAATDTRPTRGPGETCPEASVNVQASVAEHQAMGVCPKALWFTFWSL